MNKSKIIQLIRESGLFDDLYYLHQSNGMLDTELTLIEHYLEHGAKEGLDPSAQFETSFYVNNNPEVAQSVINPLVHYLTVGKAKGLLANAKQPITLATSQPLPKLIAFYLPQFHPIPENDLWWGKGFTEWTNVTKARPLFKGHYQPHLPADLGFYDLRLSESREAQADLARSYGIHGFCYYYYWFNGRRLLQRPLDEVLQSGKPDFPFCICWANENWTRRWDGLEKELLMAQEHSPESDIRFIQDVIPILKDTRYIRVNDRPLLLVYRADILPEPRQTAERWRDECRKQGVGDIVIGACRTFGITDPHPYGFDIAVDFPPHSMWMPPINDQLEDLDPDFAGNVFDYEQCVQKTLEAPPTDYPRYSATILSWDNTARRGLTAHIFHGATPAVYEQWLRQLLLNAHKNAHHFEPLVFINAWNEWAEGTHLEPDQRFGTSYLEATKSALQHFKEVATPGNISLEIPVPVAQHSTPEDFKSSYDFLFQDNEKSSKSQGNIDISIIIPVFNQINLTLECLRSLHFHKTHWIYEVIVVDDGSSDETQALISSMPAIHYIRSPQNQGFIGACNTGAEQAKGDYLVFLNNDTTVCDGWLNALRETFDTWLKVGLVGSKLIFPDGTLQECGGSIFRDGSAQNHGRSSDPYHPSYCFSRETDYTSGAAIMLSRQLFTDLNGFDDRYRPAYYEDVDLAFKVREQGFRVVVNPHARVIHHEGGTSGTDTNVGAKKYQVINQSTFYNQWKEVLITHPQRTDKVVVGAKYYPIRVLVIDWKIPRSDVDAGSVRMVAILKVLRELNCHVTLAAGDLAYEPEYAAPLERFGIEIPRQPYFESLSEYLKQNGDSFDYAIVSRRDVALMCLDDVKKYCSKAKVIFDTVDLHFLRENRQQQLLVKNNKDQQKLKGELNRKKALELDLIDRTDITIVVSPLEQEILTKLTPNKSVRVIPTLYNSAPTQRPFHSRTGILFIGWFAHKPNIDAVLWFAKEILPLLVENDHHPTFHIIGSDPTDEIRSLASDKIKVHGFVRDPSFLFNECKLSVAPLRFGAGVKGKINQSMALGLPCVSTSIGAEGMYLVDGVNVLIANEADSFAAKVNHLYKDEALWDQLRKAGLKNIEEHFSVSVAKHVLNDIIVAPKKGKETKGHLGSVCYV